MKKHFIDPILSLFYGINDDSHEFDKDDYFTFYTILVIVVLGGIALNL